MSLFDIKNRLYKKEADENLTEHKITEFDSGNSAVDSNMDIVRKDIASGDAWEEKKAGFGTEEKKIVKTGAIALGIIVAIIVIIAGIYWIRQSAFSQDRVTVAITGAKEVDSGKLVTYEISYRNDNRATLANTTLKITYPESFKPENNAGFVSDGPTVSNLNLGNINGHGEGKIVFSGKAYIPQGNLMYIKVDLEYTPSNFNSQFDTKNQLAVDVTSSPVTVELLAPQDMASGDSLDYQINYKNTGQEDLTGIKVKMDYPVGFTFSKANPAVSESDNIWYVGPLAAGESGKIVVSGKMDGTRDEIKKAQVYIGSSDNNGQFVSYSDEQTSTVIASSPFSISQTAGGQNNLIAKPGDTLRFVINYKNEGNQGLRDVIVTENIDSPVLDYASLEITGGAFDATSKKITWNAAGYPELKNLQPGKGGTIAFNIKIKDVIPVNNSNDKNFVISSIAKIDSPDVVTPLNMNKVVAGNSMDIKLDSKLVLATKGFYNDSLIPNSGLIPPKVGVETTYTMHWLASNVSNDVAQAQVEAVLPAGVSMTGKIYPEDAKISYNDRTNSVVWNIGAMSAGTGIINTPKEVAFQVKMTPAPNQVDQTPDLLGVSTFTANDLFTGDKLTATVDKKSTLLQEDTKIPSNGYRVTP